MKSKYPRLAVVTGSRVVSGALAVDVAYADPGASDRNVPVVAPFGGYAMPRSNDRVMVDEAEDGSIFAQPVSLLKPEFDVPDLKEGEFEFRFDDGTALSVRKDGNSFNVSIEASGDVEVSAEGSIAIDGTDWRSHTHDYDDSTTEGSSTKTTGGVNQ